MPNAEYSKGRYYRIKGEFTIRVVDDPQVRTAVDALRSPHVSTENLFAGLVLECLDVSEWGPLFEIIFNRQGIVPVNLLNQVFVADPTALSQIEALIPHA